MSQSQPEVPPSQGLIEGKYQLVGMIGRGGMGSVWEARHATLGTRFAIKFIESEYADSHEARSRFDKEARAAATIQSKHAIQVFDHGVTADGKPFIVMELLQGEPLDKRIDRGVLSLQDTARIIQQVCRGLARAHDQGIVHRDLKPENIFLVKTPEDDDEIAKVLDFGIAKIQNQSNPGISSTTKTGAVLGTPFYMSPEQARGLRNVDHRTDLWSLGVIAFKCVTGRLPFDGESVGDLLVKICTAPVPVPSQFAAGIPSSFDAWFLRALEREPDRRFRNVQELGESLAYAAGLTPRGSGGQGYPMSGLSTVASSQPRGSAPQYPDHMPSGPGGTPVLTPPPGAMTASPFTANSISGVQDGRGKYIVLAALLGLSVAGIGTGIAYKIRQSKQPVVTTSLPPSAATSLGSAASAPVITPEPTPSVPPLVNAEPANAVPVTAKVPPIGSAKAQGQATGTTKPATKPEKPGDKPAEKPGDKPPPLPGPMTVQPLTTAPAATAPTPPKKPNKNDPGY
ncbi:serine/threonine protein kinase [Labilithrix luteola]|nr:serine/threonine-protein kinase [Labilithrix luteola]